jgi:hypothetical protein
MGYDKGDEISLPSLNVISAVLGIISWLLCVDKPKPYWETKKPYWETIH